MKYKVWFATADSQLWSTNGMDFETVESAEAHARDLFSRWFGATDWAILPLKPELTGHLTTEVVSAEAVKRR